MRECAAQMAAVVPGRSPLVTARFDWSPVCLCCVRARLISQAGPAPVGH